MTNEAEVTEADVKDGSYYWVWIDTSTRHYKPEQPLVLGVAQASRADKDGRLYWEGCGTDEGVRVVKVVAEITPPDVELP